MKQVSPKIYSKDYYLNVCLGSDDYKKTMGNKLNEKWEKILKLASLRKGMKVLDLGCGRGEVEFYLAKKGITVIGIDYSKDAVKIASASLKTMPKNVQRFVKFYCLDAKKIDFGKNSFDAVVSFDVFEHLYKKELDIVMKNISTALKENGLLIVHTETNKIYLDFTHKYFVYPIGSLLVKINNIFVSKDYQGPPKDPRNEYHKSQHVNEPTIFYLRRLFNSYSFKGKIISVTGVLKPVLGWKDIIYNVVVCLYPFSLFPPLNILFTTEYICLMRNKKLA
jgi:SAM-dependent methyltransferase